MIDCNSTEFVDAVCFFSFQRFTPDTSRRTTAYTNASMVITLDAVTAPSMTRDTTGAVLVFIHCRRTIRDAAVESRMIPAPTSAAMAGMFAARPMAHTRLAVGMMCTGTPRMAAVMVKSTTDIGPSVAMAS